VSQPAESLQDRLVRRFGDEIVDWVRAAPGEAVRLAAEWGLTLGETIPRGSTSLTVMCTTAAGREAVLKLSPQTAVLAEQDQVLRAWAPGGHVPQVLAHAPGALLLERVLPGTAVKSPDPAAFAALLDALHSAPVPDDFVAADLAYGTEQFLCRTERMGSPVVGPDDFARARAERDRLIATSPQPVLLHGDLHYSNMLDGGARGLIAIDPKATLGERAFDAVDFVLDATAPVQERLAVAVAATGLDADRLAGWCRVAAPTIAVSLARRGLDPSDVLRFARATS
jgi:streptomycin 6-kinase